MSASCQEIGACKPGTLLPVCWAEKENLPKRVPVAFHFHVRDGTVLFSRG
jgi:hypothetical protein